MANKDGKGQEPLNEKVRPPFLNWQWEQQLYLWWGSTQLGAKKNPS